MKKKLVLKAELRDKTGSRWANEIRRQGRVPAIVYGHKKEPTVISLNAHNLTEGLHHGVRVIDLQIEEKNETVMFKDLQYDHLGRNIIHVDLVRVNVSEMVKLTVPIEYKGTAKGTHEGGIIEPHLDALEVECKVTDIPESIIVLVKDVGIGDTIHAKDVELSAGIKLISAPDALLVTCSLVAAAKSTEELEEEAPAAPEVIGEAEESEETEKK